MAKVKTCQYLDAKRTGSLIFIDKKCKMCCDKETIIETVDDYSNLDIDTIIEKRKKFIEDFYNGKQKICENCHQLIEDDYENLESDKISWLNISSYTTCSLRCKYCYFDDKQLGEKMSESRKLLLPIFKRIHDKGVLSDKIALSIAGGEPLLFDDIPETLEFLSKHYKHPQFMLLSNSTITSKVEKVVDALKRIKFSFTNLVTSLDSGTRETFEKIRGRDMFDIVKNNIMTYAKNNSFTQLQLKYILLNNKEKDMYNLSDEDINGFCDFVKQVKMNTKSDLQIIIERDLYDGRGDLDDEIYEAAVKIVTYAIKNNISYTFSPCGYINKSEVSKIISKAISNLCDVKNINSKNNQIVATEPICGLNINIVINGSDNIIKLGKMHALSKEKSNLNIYINANNSTIELGENVKIDKNLTIVCGRKFNSQSENVTIKIGKLCSFGDAKIETCHNDSELVIDDYCMVGNDVYITNTDNHPIYTHDTKKILNRGKSLKIGLHSWIGDRVSILKNVHLKDNTMIGIGSVVTKSFDENRCFIAGNPAKIVKRNVDWSMDCEKFL